MVLKYKYSYLPILILCKLFLINTRRVKIVDIFELISKPNILTQPTKFLLLIKIHKNHYIQHLYNFISAMRPRKKKVTVPALFLMYPRLSIECGMKVCYTN